MRINDVDFCEEYAKSISEDEFVSHLKDSIFWNKNGKEAKESELRKAWKLINKAKENRKPEIKG